MTVTGEVDASNCGRLESAFCHLIDGGVRYILLNAGEMRFCDVAGARVMARTHTLLAARDGRLVIATSASVARVLGIVWSMSSAEPPQIIAGQAGAKALSARMADTPPPGPRHVRAHRRLGSASPVRGVRAAAPRADEWEPPAAPAKVMAVAHPQPAREEATRRPPRGEDRRVILERSARLREETERRLRTLQDRLQVTCASLAEVHERLADFHVALSASATRRGDTSSCDGDFHQAKAEQIRRRAVVFADAVSAGPPPAGPNA